MQFFYICFDHTMTPMFLQDGNYRLKMKALYNKVNVMEPKELWVSSSRKRAGAVL